MKSRLSGKTMARDSGCVDWTGAKTARGYGKAANGRGGWEMAHRVAWQEANGEIPNDMEVCHRCDRPSCVNVVHLFLGSHAENMADMVAKGRSAGLRGSANHKAKLNPEIVAAIRASSESHSALGRRYGVSYVAIRQARLGRTWGPSP